jgi:glyoxylate reductase
MDSKTRKDFINNLSANGKYTNVVGFYRHNSSADQIGIFDAELINALPQSCKWIAHNGAGYDQIDVDACKKRGMYAFSVKDHIVNGRIY